MSRREPIYSLHKNAPLHPLEKWTIRTYSRVRKEKVIRNFIRFFEAHSEAPNEKLLTIMEDLHETLASDARKFGVQTIERPKVFFIPETYRARILKHTDSHDDLGGLYSPALHAVVVFTHPEQSDLTHARILSHELKHAYSFKLSSLEVNKPDEKKSLLSMRTYRSGMSLHARNERNYGNAFNELAAEMFSARYTSEKLSKWMPDEYQAFVARAKEFLKKRNDINRVFTPEELSEFYDPKVGKARIAFTSYTENTRALGTVVQNIPDGHTLLETACFTGNFMPLARAFEAKYGKGSFRVFMTLNTESWDDANTYTFAFRDGNSRRLTKAIKALLADRPHDYKKVFGEAPKVKAKR